MKKLPTPEKSLECSSGRCAVRLIGEPWRRGGSQQTGTWYHKQRWGESRQWLRGWCAGARGSSYQKDAAPSTTFCWETGLWTWATARPQLCMYPGTPCPQPRLRPDAPRPQPHSRQSLPWAPFICKDSGFGLFQEMTKKINQKSASCQLVLCKKACPFLLLWNLSCLWRI